MTATVDVGKHGLVAVLYERTVCPMDSENWIAVCAHRLQKQWRTVDPELLEEVAGDLWNDKSLRKMAPDAAAAAWLEPVARRGH